MGLYGFWMYREQIVPSIPFSKNYEQQEQPNGLVLTPLGQVEQSDEPYGPHLDEGLWLYGTASWYSQHNLIQSRKDIAGSEYGTASRIYPLGTIIRVCNTNNARCVDMVVNDFCEACSNTYPDRVLDIQKEAFAELSNNNLGAGVIHINYFIK